MYDDPDAAATTAAVTLAAEAYGYATGRNLSGLGGALTVGLIALLALLQIFGVFGGSDE